MTQTNNEWSLLLHDIHLNVLVEELVLYLVTSLDLSLETESSQRRRLLSMNSRAVWILRSAPPPRTNNGWSLLLHDIHLHVLVEELALYLVTSLDLSIESRILRRRRLLSRNSRQVWILRSVPPP